MLRSLWGVATDHSASAGLLLGRWRKLEGSDPSTYEMIQKIQTLQKRLIGKTEEVVEKDLLIQVCRVGHQNTSHASVLLPGFLGQRRDDHS
jgi:hypothetical protein